MMMQQGTEESRTIEESKSKSMTKTIEDSKSRSMTPSVVNQVRKDRPASSPISASQS